jgi:hypothetical protein
MATFLLDEYVNPTTAEIARGLRLDVVSIHEVGRRGLHDWQQLDFAVSEHRSIVTRNRDDYVKLTVDAYQAGKPHFGVIIVPYSIPNKHPDRIARALKPWSDKWGPDYELSPYFIDFLSEV